MPIEERFVTFALDEVYKAVSIKCMQEDMPVPPEGTLKAIELTDDQGGSEDIIYLSIEPQNGGALEKVKFHRKFFAMALVFYCQGSGIPLPKRGTKTLAIMEDKIIMKISLEEVSMDKSAAA